MRDRCEVMTTGGRLRGARRMTTDGTEVDGYFGVPYGESTADDLRFGPPVRAERWSGVRSALFHGPIAPQSTSTQGMVGRGHDEDNYLLRRGSNGCLQGEDCLRVNVWTSGAGRRPVLVYLHGGAFSGGSGNDLAAYDGANLAARHDLVVVTANHRLNAFGFLDLAALDVAGYERHVNAGLQDLVLLLRWIRDNAPAFGGDPDSVTVVGQSGGGMKVAALMSMPAARGLFHRGIIQSGSMTDINARDESLALTLDLLAEVGVDPAHLERLGELPLDRLISAVSELGGVWAPTVDGEILTEPLVGAAAATHADVVPLVVGTNLAEFVNGVDNPDAERFGPADLAATARASFGCAADAVVSEYRRQYPDEDEFGLHAALGAWWVRALAERQAAACSAAGVPVHAYVFAHSADVVAPRVRTYHGCEIAYAFDNADHCRAQTGGAPEARQVAHEMAGAWAAFAHTGDPNGRGLPPWAPWTPAAPATMLYAGGPSGSRTVIGLDEVMLRWARGRAVPGLHGA